MSNRRGLDEDDGGLEIALESTARRPLTRSSIKPRLLFPPAKAEDAENTKDDEEAATDIEDHVLAEMESGKPATPLELIEEAPGTPEAPRFAPASPPATTRITRLSSKKAADATPIAAKRPNKRSPFDDWRRVKSGAQSSGHKRPGDELSASASKRTKA